MTPFVRDSHHLVAATACSGWISPMGSNSMLASMESFASASVPTSGLELHPSKTVP
jgi:hypothetical protein